MSQNDDTGLTTGGRLVSLTDGREFVLEGEATVIGRDAACDVVITGRQVSRRHAEIVRTARGYVVVDTSTNGTLVNGKRLEQRRVLARGDVIACGLHELRFYLGPAPDVEVDAGALPRGARQRLSDTLHGIPAAPPPAPGGRLGNTMHGMPAPPPPGAHQRLSDTMHGLPAEPSAPVAPRAPPLATLIVRAGPLKGQRFTVRTPVTNIGRGEYNDIVVPDASVSTMHAKLQRREGIWVVTDLQSTNGTTVDGGRVDDETVLAPGSVVQFGDVPILFEPTDDDVRAQPGGGTRVVKAIDEPQGRQGPNAS